MFRTVGPAPARIGSSRRFDLEVKTPSFACATLAKWQPGLAHPKITQTDDICVSREQKK